MTEPPLRADAVEVGKELAALEQRVLGARRETEHVDQGIQLREEFDVRRDADLQSAVLEQVEQLLAHEVLARQLDLYDFLVSRGPAA